MAKKTTTTKNDTTAPRLEKAAPNVSPPPVKPRPTAKVAPAKTEAAKKTASPQPVASYTQDEVALRAYFIAEKRQQSGLSGDAHSDWVEAERQLASEVETKKKAPRR